MKTIEDIRDAFERIHGYATGDIGRPYMSIPARPEHDADLILVSAIDELAASRETIAKLKGELGRLATVASALSQATWDAAHPDAAPTCCPALAEAK